MAKRSEAVTHRPKVSPASTVLPADGTRLVIVPEAMDDGSPAPAAAAQRRLWFVDRLGAGHAYNLSAWHWSDRPFELEALRAAVRDVAKRHQPLRTRLVAHEGDVRQVVESGSGPSFEIVDLTSRGGDAVTVRADLVVEELARRPFDLGAAPPVRLAVIRTVKGDGLVFVGHHALVDGPSLGIFFDETLAAYEARLRGEAPALSPLAATYGDYVAWETRHRETTDHLAYWKTTLDGSPLTLELPLDRPRPAERSYEGASYEFSFGLELSNELRALRQTQRVSSFMLILALYQSVLARCGDQETVLVGTPVSHRLTPEFRPLIGMFANTLPIRTDIPRGITVGELLRRVRVSVLGAMDHASTPLEDIIDALRPERHGAYTPYVQAAFVMHNGVGRDPYRVETRAAFWDLTLFAWEDDDHTIRGMFRYATAVFDEPTIARLSSHVVELARGFVSGPEASVHAIPLLGAHERQAILAWSSRPSVARDERVDTIFTRRVAATPDAPAVVWGNDRLSYAELNARAERLADALRHRDVEGRLVGLHASRSMDFVVAALATLKAGAAYLPLDPAHPAERLAFMLQDADVRVVLSDNPAEAPTTAVEVLPIGGGGEAPRATARTTTPRTGTAATDMAYVMFTSGSTGRPKGVVVPHRGIVRLVTSTNYVEFEPTDAVAMASNTAFDASTFEIWGALLNGARLVGLDRETLLSPSRLADAIREHNLTVLFLTTALFHQIASLAPAVFERLRYLVVGGEAVAPAVVRAVVRAGAPTHLVNGYGPTENTTFSSAYDMVDVDLQVARMPIGQPIAGSSCYVLDANRALVPIGGIGELYVGGDGLALGYLNRPELTAERFVAHPFVEGARLFRTGDRARWRADGVLEFLGRTDRQIKLRGYRIEPGEIEHALLADSQVGHCAVILRDTASEPSLVAYWTASGAPAPGDSSLRERLRRTLPEYMVPTAFVQLAALPLTANGKLDVAALPIPERRAADTPSSRPPSTPAERLVAESWSAVLEVDRPGVDDDFFVMGGTSLLALKLASRLEAASGRSVSIGDVFANPTIARLATVVTAERNDTDSLVREVRKGGSKPPLYWPPGLLGESAGCDEILARLPADQPVFTLKPPTIESSTDTLEAMSVRLADEIERHQPSGPICLAGYSFAGLLAYHIARELLLRGRTIPLLAVLDAWPDERPPGTAPQRLWAFACNAAPWVYENIVRTRRRSWRMLARALALHVWNTAMLLLGRAPIPTLMEPDDIWEGRVLTERTREAVRHRVHVVDRSRFEPYPGRLVLFRARVRPLVRPQFRDLGWKDLVDELEVVDLPGGHQSLMLPPTSTVLAKELAEHLEAAARAQGQIDAASLATTSAHPRHHDTRAGR